MGNFLTWATLFFAYFLSRIAEGRIHRFNYDLLTFAGAEELIPSTMRWFYRLVYLFLPLAVFEYFAAASQLPSWVGFASLAILAMSLLVRVWTITTMGRLWTMRCLALAGVEPVRSGPFRFFRHPEYVTRVCDGLGLFLFIGSWVTALLYAIVTLLVVIRIASIERRQMCEFTSQPI